MDFPRALKPNGRLSAPGRRSRGTEVSAAGAPADARHGGREGAPPLRGEACSQRRRRHGVGIQLAGLPGALLLLALPALPAALRSHQAAEELRGQHRRAAARPPLAAGALGLLPRADPLKEPGRMDLLSHWVMEQKCCPCEKMRLCSLETANPVKKAAVLGD